MSYYALSAHIVCECRLRWNRCLSAIMSDILQVWLTDGHCSLINQSEDVNWEHDVSSALFNEDTHAGLCVCLFFCVCVFDYLPLSGVCSALFPSPVSCFVFPFTLYVCLCLLCLSLNLVLSDLEDITLQEARKTHTNTHVHTEQCTLLQCGCRRDTSETDWKTNKQQRRGREREIEVRV